MEVKKSRSIVLAVLMIVGLSLMSYFVFGGLDQLGFVNDQSLGLSPYRWANISGTNVNLSFALNQSYPVGGAGSNLNMNATNISVMWQLTINNSIMANVTVFNGSVIAVAHIFNRTFDTTALPDGIYNLTIIFYNISSADATGGKRINVSLNQTFIVVDNTAPNVTLYQNQSDFSNLTAASNNVTLFNFSVVDTIPGLAINSTRLRTIIVQFDNASYGYFNVSVHSGPDPTTNASNPGTVGVSYATEWIVCSVCTQGSGLLNLSHLRAGYHTMRIYVNDSANNTNDSTSLTETFILNTPPNVTWVGMSMLNTTVANGVNWSLIGNSQISGPTFGQNFSLNGTNIIVFNISVQNGSIYNSSLTIAAWNNRHNESPFIILMFDNATGNDFNLTALRTDPGSASYVVAHSSNASYNVSSLAEGNHTVTVFANDTINNWNHTEKIVFMVDKTAPALTITCDTGKTTGQTVSCTCTATDALSGVVDGPVFAGSNTATESTSVNTAGSFTTSACLATDEVGNAASTTSTFTVTTTTSGGGGGGGSSGGSSTGKVGSYEKKVWTSINAGETATVEPKKGEMPVTKVEFKVTETIRGAWVQVAKVEKADLPSKAAAKLTGKVNSFIEISKNELSVKENLLSEITIEFKVEKKWLADNAVDKNDLVLLRYLDAEDKWTELGATLKEDTDATYLHYIAATPGFSYFAVAEKGAAAEAEVVDIPLPAGKEPAGTAGEVAGETAGEAMAPKEGAGSSVWLWVVLGLVVLAALVWAVKRRR